MKISAKLPLLLLCSSILAACGVTEDTADNNKNNDNSQGELTLKLDLPDSVTGGHPVTTTAKAGFSRFSLKTGTIRQAASTENTADENCAFAGIDDEDPFRNGYQTTKFMTSVMASWTCIADMLIGLSDIMPHNGLIVESDNDTNSADFKASDPTHYSITDDSASQTTVRLYYNYNRSTPPIVGEDEPQFYVSWNKAENGDVTGKMVIDASNMGGQNRASDDPVKMRMDFNFTVEQKTADMLLAFDENNPWANAMRIHLLKDLTANSLDQVFTIRGLIDMKNQFFPVDGIDEIPQIKFITVSDAFGNGAAFSEFNNISLPMEISSFTGNHLGNYLFTKLDKVFFDANGDSSYVNKTVTRSQYRGSRTTDNNSQYLIDLNVIIDLLGLDAAYFSGDLCANIGDNCNELLNGIFNTVNDIFGQDTNRGEDPQDWRTDALDNASYLDTVYSNGEDATTAYDYSFTLVP